MQTIGAEVSLVMEPYVSSVPCSPSPACGITFNDTEIEQFSEFRVKEARDDSTDILTDADVVRQVPASTGNVYRATHQVD